MGFLTSSFGIKSSFYMLFSITSLRFTLTHHVILCGLYNLVNISSGICLQILARKVKFAIHTDFSVQVIIWNICIK